MTPYVVYNDLFVFSFLLQVDIVDDPKRKEFK